MGKTAQKVRAKKYREQKKKRATKKKMKARNRCPICGRSRGYMRYFKMCRICFRERAHKGELPGVKKASW